MLEHPGLGSGGSGSLGFQGFRGFSGFWTVPGFLGSSALHPCLFPWAFCACSLFFHRFLRFGKLRSFGCSRAPYGHYTMAGSYYSGVFTGVPISGTTSSLFAEKVSRALGCLGRALGCFRGLADLGISGRRRLRFRLRDPQTHKPTNHKSHEKLW